MDGSVKKKYSRCPNGMRRRNGACVSKEELARIPPKRQKAVKQSKTSKTLKRKSKSILPAASSLKMAKPIMSIPESVHNNSLTRKRKHTHSAAAPLNNSLKAVILNSDATIIPSSSTQQSFKQNNKTKQHSSNKNKIQAKVLSSPSIKKSSRSRSHSHASITGPATPSHVKTAIIVPFRDLESTKKNSKGGVRTQQLQRFISYMSTYFNENHGGMKHTYKIFIMEQNPNDGKKFNRGKLLNIGFKMAQKEGYNLFIFHDVDLLPSANLKTWYTTFQHSPVHVAAVWKRYGYTGYFGGVVAFTEADFEKINGFPNNLWGWGGEDDELGERVHEMEMHIIRPTTGKYLDLENKGIEDKMKELRVQRAKCMNKREVLNEHAKTWKTNGLNSLKYSKLRESSCGKNCERIVVDLKTNGHWTDKYAALDNYDCVNIKRKKS